MPPVTSFRDPVKGVETAETQNSTDREDREDREDSLNGSLLGANTIPRDDHYLNVKTWRRAG